MQRFLQLCVLKFLWKTLPKSNTFFLCECTLMLVFLFHFFSCFTFAYLLLNYRECVQTWIPRYITMRIHNQSWISGNQNKSKTSRLISIVISVFVHSILFDDFEAGNTFECALFSVKVRIRICYSCTHVHVHISNFLSHFLGIHYVFRPALQLNWNTRILFS